MSNGHRKSRRKNGNNNSNNNNNNSKINVKNKNVVTKLNDEIVDENEDIIFTEEREVVILNTEEKRNFEIGERVSKNISKEKRWEPIISFARTLLPEDFKICDIDYNTKIISFTYKKYTNIVYCYFGNTNKKKDNICNLPYFNVNYGDKIYRNHNFTNIDELESKRKDIDTILNFMNKLLRNKDKFMELAEINNI